MSNCLDIRMSLRVDNPVEGRVKYCASDPVRSLVWHHACYPTMDHSVIRIRAHVESRAYQKMNQ